MIERIPVAVDIRVGASGLARASRNLLRAAFLAGALVALLWLPARANAQEQAYTPDDTLQAIEDASGELGVSSAFLYRVVRCETGGTFNPYAVGRQGELGPVQLHPRGRLPDFYARGYSNPFDPYEAVRYLAQEALAGRTYAWSCAR